MFEIKTKLNKILEQKSTDRNFIDSLDDYINSIENNLNSWLKNFEWNKEILIQKHGDILHKNNSNEKEFFCPFDSSHTRIKKANLTKHIETCDLKRQNYTIDEIKDIFRQPESHSKDQLKLTDKKDSNDLVKIVCDNTEYHRHPTELITLDNKHVFTDLTPKERLGVHEYALKFFNDQGFKTNTNKDSFLDLSNFDDQGKKNGENVFIDLFDKKRRPKSYKTSKSISHTEKIKQLIDYQMGLLEDLNKKDTKYIQTLKAEQTIKNKRRSRSQDSDLKRRKSQHRERSSSRHNEEKSKNKKHKSHKKKKSSKKCHHHSSDESA